MKSNTRDTGRDVVDRKDATFTTDTDAPVGEDVNAGTDRYDVSGDRWVVRAALALIAVVYLSWFASALFAAWGDLDELHRLYSTALGHVVVAITTLLLTRQRK